MNKKLTFSCPCGFYCETVRQEDALALVELHVTRSHGDQLPFGITRPEALALLREEHVIIEAPQKRKTADHHVMLIQ